VIALHNPQHRKSDRSQNPKTPEMRSHSVYNNKLLKCICCNAIKN
jgi:hypothetical protein